MRITARKTCWTLLDVTAGRNCLALHLLADELAGPRTLLFPFDRFRPLGTGRPAVVSVHRWRQHLHRLLTRLHPAGALRTAAASRIRLLPYQLEPALAMVRRGVTRLLIADDVGLGKTIQAGLIAAELLARSAGARVLILTPAGLRDQWRHELARMFDLSCLLADAAWLKSFTTAHPVDANPWALSGVYLASHDFVKQPEVLRPLEEVVWDLVVVDEAHAATSRTDRRTAIHALCSRSRRVALLTATPHADEPAEYAALCDIGRLDPGEEPISLFARTRRQVGGGQPRRSRLLLVRPSEAELRMHELLGLYTKRVWQESAARGDATGHLLAAVLQKRALSSAASLALSLRRRLAMLVDAVSTDEAWQLRLPMGEEEALEDDVSPSVLAAPGLDNAARERRWLALIAEAAWRASAQESKMRFLKRLLDRVREPAVIFTEYRDTLQRLARAFAGCRTRTLLTLHGGMTPAERSRAQQAFNDADAILLATDAAAEGLNLHGRCRFIVHYELPWSTARLEQRAGRVDRLGQMRPVHETALVGSTRAERMVLAPLLRRAARAALSDQPPSGLPARLTESRVAELICADDAAAAPPARQRPSIHVPTAAVHVEAEARAEVERVQELRSLIVPGQHHVDLPPDRPVASRLHRRRSDLGTGLVLVYLVTLSSAGRPGFHHSPVAVHFSLAGGLRRLAGRTGLRSLVACFADRVPQEAGPMLETAARAALATALPLQAGVDAALLRRERWMHAQLRSAARGPVQAGLFERQWRSARSAGSRIADHLDSGGGPTVGPIACVETRLAAALLVSDR